jgi:hypothetical protein
VHFAVLYELRFWLDDDRCEFAFARHAFASHPQPCHWDSGANFVDFCLILHDAATGRALNHQNNHVLELKSIETDNINEFAWCHPQQLLGMCTVIGQKIIHCHSHVATQFRIFRAQVSAQYPSNVPLQRHLS